MKRKSLLCPAVLAASLALYLFLAYCVPYSATDDWQWGMEEGLRWWLGGLLNGRYVGNFFAVIMCRSPVVKVLVMGVSMFLIPFFMALLAARGEDRRFLPAFLFCNAGILLMPPAMWREVFCWVSGFGNYGLSAAFFLLWLLLLRHVSRRRTRPALWSAVFFPLTLAMGLFVENLSLFFLGAALALALYSVWDKPLRPPFLACLAGAALAAFFMFFNGLFTQLAGEGAALNGLRQLTFSLSDGLPAALADMARWYLGRLLPIPFLRGGCIALPMAVITAWGFWDSRLRPLTPLGLLPLGCCWLIWSSQVYFTPLRIAACCLCWALALLALLVQRCPQEIKLSRVLLYLAAPLSLAPLAGVTTLGQRFYFFPMVMLVLVAADLASPLLARRAGVCLAGGLMVALMALWGYRSAVVNACTQLRLELTRQAAAQAADTLILPSDRYERVVWYSRDPWNAEYADYFRRFYHVPDQTTLIFLPAGSYERWPDIAPEDWAQRVELAPSKDYVPSLP